MPNNNITGELNNTDPVCLPGVDNQGATVESDSDLSDGMMCATGYVDVAKFPATAPGIDEQKKAANARAAKSPKGDDATAQTYRAEVPFSGTALQLGSGSSAGGAGAALTTGGNVFVGATGKITMQSLAAFTGQTTATMGLYAGAGVTAHSQDKFEIYAGGGVAPGKCGSGGPAGSAGTTKPAEAAEKWTNVGCNALGVVKGLNDMRNANTWWKGTASDKVTMLKGATDALGKGTQAVMGGIGTDKDTLKTTSKVADTTSGVLNVIGGLTKLKEDPVGAASSIVSGIGGVSGAFGGSQLMNSDGPVAGSDGATDSVPGNKEKKAKAKAAGGGGGGGAGGGGGPLDIEKRAATKIHQCCPLKISGNAPEGIDWKVGGAYLVNAVALVDFQTTNWGAFAAAIFKVRAVALVDVKCRRFEMKAVGTGTVKTVSTTITASTLSLLDGVTDVTETLTVLKHTTLHDELHCDNGGKASLVKGNLTVKKDTTHQDDAKIYKTFTVKDSITINGRYVSKSQLKAASEGKFG